MAPSDGEGDKNLPPPVVDKTNLWKITNLAGDERATLRILKCKVATVKRLITTRVNKSSSDIARFEGKPTVTASDYERIRLSSQEDDKKVSTLVSENVELLFEEIFKFFQDTLLEKYNNEEEYTLAETLLIKEEKKIIDQVQAFTKHLDKSLEAIFERVEVPIPQPNVQTAPHTDQGGSASTPLKWGGPKKGLAPTGLVQDCTILEHRDFIGKLKHWLGFWDDIQP